MNKDQLAVKLSNQFNISQSLARSMVDFVTDCFIDTLKKHDEIGLVGFGRLVVRERVARKGRNPQTGEVLYLPVTRTVGFIPSKTLRNTLNRRQDD